MVRISTAEAATSAAIARTTSDERILERPDLLIIGAYLSGRDGSEDRHRWNPKLSLAECWERSQFDDPSVEQMIDESQYRTVLDSHS
jgi:hypothetical protein